MNNIFGFFFYNFNEFSGRRLSDPLEVSYHPNIRRELPSDLSDKALRKEAALVLSQADRARNGQTHVRLARTSSDPKRRKEGISKKILLKKCNK